jgi:predicted nuclease of predicted toxin-antitoxin system
LPDQDVYALTIQFINGLGHDILPVAQLGLSREDDVVLLQIAHQQGRIFVTRDRDFGGIVFVHGLRPGVIYLRIFPSTLKSVHSELGRVLTLYNERELQASFVVVEPGRHRIRKLPRP